MPGVKAVVNIRLPRGVIPTATAPESETSVRAKSKQGEKGREI